MVLSKSKRKAEDDTHLNLPEEFYEGVGLTDFIEKRDSSHTWVVLDPDCIEIV